MKRNIILSFAAAALAFAPGAFAEDSTLGVTVGPEASFVSTSASTSLSKGDTTFGAYTGTTNFTYKIRTTTSGGAGAITVSLTTFGAAGAPALADLSYTSTAPAPGIAVGVTAALLTTATPVLSFAAAAHSADVGDAGTAIWTLLDKPTMLTGSYTSTATFTISAS